MLTSYLRDKSNNPIGVVVAVKHNDEIRLGWSKCHSLLERFNRQKGIEIALGRAKCNRPVKHPLPHDIRYALVNLLQRAEKYYKNVPMSNQAFLLTGIADSMTTLY